MTAPGSPIFIVGGTTEGPQRWFAEMSWTVAG